MVFINLYIKIENNLILFCELFVTGSLDSTIKLWDFSLITDENTSEEGGANNATQKEEKFLLRSFATKNSPIKNLHFTRRNLLLAVGSYEGSS